MFKVKKSSSSRRIARQMKKQSLKEQAENERWEAEEKKRREEARKATPASPPVSAGWREFTHISLLSLSHPGIPGVTLCF